jgi:hypothetical protein
MSPEAAGFGQARVLLVDDHALLRTGVANIINQEPDLQVVAEAGNGVEAIEAYERTVPTSRCSTFGCPSWKVSRPSGGFANAIRVHA